MRPLVRFLGWDVPLEKGYRLPSPVFFSFPGGSTGKESACNVGDLGWEDPLEKREAIHPLQYSGPENFMDFIVHGVAKSQTQLSDFHFTSFSSTEIVINHEQCGRKEH